MSMRRALVTGQEIAIAGGGELLQLSLGSSQ